MKRRLHNLNIPDQEILNAIVRYVSLDHLDEARSIYSEAQRGNKVAQYIAGMALRKIGKEEAAKLWLTLSAEQGYKPAEKNLKIAG